MAALCTIIQKCINKEQPPILPNHTLYTYWNDILTTMQLSLIQSIYYTYIAHIYYDNMLDKFGYIKTNVLDNAFISNELKAEFLTVFAKIQKTYYGFSRLVHIYKLRRAKLVINTDLYLNTISPEQNNVITIYQHDSTYLFIINDLIRILNNDLSCAPNFFVEPLVSKNPYNNVIFDKTILYNIYFFIKFKNGMVMPDLLHKYFITNFNIDQFKTDNECLIRDIAIKSCVYSSSYYELFPNVIFMLASFNKRILIHRDFPKEQLVNIMRPYLHLYYNYKYAVYGSEKRYESYTILNKKLKLFAQFNPKFGRKYIHFIDKNVILDQYHTGPKYKYPHTITFNDKHADFYKDYTNYDFPMWDEEYQPFNYHLINMLTTYGDSDDDSGYDSVS